MKDLIEIRWHGRGGQGAKTAALLLADVAFNNGLYVQGFPEYGPERMGAPITAYNRLSKTQIRVHSNIYEPDYVVVVDETLIESVDVTAGVKEGGAVIVNTAKTKEEITDEFKFDPRQTDYYFNAGKYLGFLTEDKIAVEENGKIIDKPAIRLSNRGKNLFNVKYKKRQLESAGDFLTFPVLKPIFRWGVGFCGSFSLACLTAGILATMNIGEELPIFIAGIMIFISMFELLPTSFKYKNRGVTILFFIIGILFMYINSIIF